MPDTISVEAQRVIGAFEDCWNRHDIQAFAELFAPDAQFVNVVGIWWRGRDEIRAAHEFAHSAMFKDSRLHILETETRLLADGLALARSRWTLQGHRATDGSLLSPRDGLLLIVLHHQVRQWLIIDAQNTDIIEGAVSRPQ